MKYIAAYFGGNIFPSCNAVSGFLYRLYHGSDRANFVGDCCFGLRIFIILKGVAEGIEKISKVLMPALFLC